MGVETNFEGVETHFLCVETYFAQALIELGKISSCFYNWTKNVLIFRQHVLIFFFFALRDPGTTQTFYSDAFLPNSDSYQRTVPLTSSQDRVMILCVVASSGISKHEKQKDDVRTRLTPRRPVMHCCVTCPDV